MLFFVNPLKLQKCQKITSYQKERKRLQTQACAFLKESKISVYALFKTKQMSFLWSFGTKKVIQKCQRARS